MNTRRKPLASGLFLVVLLLLLQGAAGASSFDDAMDAGGERVCLTDCDEIQAAMDKFSETRSLKSEKDELEFMLYRIRSSGLRFDRNGQVYDSKDATSFLRWKIGWYASKHHEMIKTDEDFVEKILKGSEKTGEPYSLIMKDGKRYNAQSVMKHELNMFNENRLHDAARLTVLNEVPLSAEAAQENSQPLNPEH